MLVEVSSSGRDYTVHRVVCAIDCGRVINPDTVVQQMEGGIIYGLTAAMKTPVIIRDGACGQSNFHDLPVLRINESPPVIDVHIVNSDEAPGGVGEVAVPPIAPALAHAIFVATGKRLRSLPLILHA
jgi:CO/xanthine dehydrogenase Mo-binding subunit